MNQIPPNPRRLGYASALALVILLISALSGYLAILLALAPTAYLLVGDSVDASATTVLTTHLAAVGAGGIAYLLLMQGIDPTAVAPQSIEALRVVASVILAMGMTAVVLSRFSAQLSTAHVTTATVAVGLFQSPGAIGALVLGIALVSALHAMYRGLAQQPVRN